MKKKATKPVKHVKHVKAKVEHKTVEPKVETTTPVVESNVNLNLPAKKDHADGIVKIIAILGWIGSVVFMLSGLVFIFFRDSVMNQVRQLPPTAGYEMITPSSLTWMGIFMLLFGALWFVVCLHLWTFKKWARIVGIVLASVGALSGLLSFPSGWFQFLVHGIVLYFLAFHPGVKKLFE